MKTRRLRDIVRGYGRCVVAFSGGVDSALVVAIAARELGSAALAVTGISPSLPAAERAAAAAFARENGAAHELLETHELDDPNYAANPLNRCYYCKTELYAGLKQFAAARGFATLADGLNADDLGEVRFGRRAAEEHGVRSPLADAGFTKADVRRLARDLGLSVAEKPAAACLSSRFPTGAAISRELLDRVERAERVLHESGFVDCRVRHHDDVARIEVPAHDIERLARSAAHIVAAVRATGYRFVALDLAGYVRGGVAAGGGLDGSVIDLVSMR